MTGRTDRRTGVRRLVQLQLYHRTGLQRAADAHPDAHFFTEVRYKGTKTIAISPDYSEVAKLCDQWLSPKQGTDSALAMAMGHVILKEFHLNNPSDYFLSYARRYTDMPMLVLLEENEAGYYTSGRLLRAADLADGLGETNNPEWKTVAFSETGDWWRRTAPPVSAGAKGQMEHGTAGGGPGGNAASQPD